eukprot:1183359-Prorocentrum_minimum.AAC.2
MDSLVGGMDSLAGGVDSLVGGVDSLAREVDSLVGGVDSLAGGYISAYCRGGHMLSPLLRLVPAIMGIFSLLLRLVPAMGIFSLFFCDWCPLWVYSCVGCSPFRWWCAPVGGGRRGGDRAALTGRTAGSSRRTRSARDPTAPSARCRTGPSPTSPTPPVVPGPAPP